jgi:inner membrane protein
LGTCFYRPSEARAALLLGALCSAIPDLDVIGFRFGVHYGDFWGHRGFTHSLAFAAVLAALAATVALPRGTDRARRVRLLAYLFLATASHGVLDAMTDGGLGVAFFSPFDNSRYFLPWTPIQVSPIGIGRFFTARGLPVLESEFLWIWIPSALLAGTALLLWARGNKAHAAVE